MENISLVSEITDKCNGGVMAHIKKHDSYIIEFDVIGDCVLDIRQRDEVTDKIIKSINPTTNLFMTGSYRFLLLATRDGILKYELNGDGMLTNIKVLKGGSLK